MQRKEKVHIATDLLKKIDVVRDGFKLGSHIGLTDLQRRTDWHERFIASKMFEILERNQPFAVMLKPEIFDALRKYITVLEQQLEELQIEIMFTQRTEEHIDWTTRDDLKQKAKENFHHRQAFGWR